MLSNRLCAWAVAALLGVDALAAVPTCATVNSLAGKKAFVSATGLDTNSGATLSAPKRTLGSALARVKDGGVLWVVGDGRASEFVLECAAWSRVPSGTCETLVGMAGTTSTPVEIKGCHAGPSAAPARVRVLATPTTIDDPRGARNVTVHIPGSDQWSRVAGGAPDEFQSTFVLPLPRNSSDSPEKPQVQASFRDGPQQTALARYTRIEDFRTSEQTYQPVTCVPSGSAPAQGQVQVGTCRLPSSAVGLSYRRPIHVGPGTFVVEERDANGKLIGWRIHVRLESTTHGVAGVANYVKPSFGTAWPILPPILFAYNRAGVAIAIGNSSNVLIKDLDIRSPAEGVRVNGGARIAFENVRLSAISPALRISKDAVDVSFNNGEIDGSLPDWLFRNDVKDGDQPSELGELLVDIQAGSTGTRISGSILHRGLDGLSLSGQEMIIRGNRIENLRDDAIHLRPVVQPAAATGTSSLITVTPVTGVIRDNRISRVYSVFAYRTSVDPPAGETRPLIDVPIVQNHLDLRRGALETRPAINEAVDPASVYSQSMVWQNGGNNGPTHSFLFVHNSVITAAFHPCPSSVTGACVPQAIPAIFAHNTPSLKPHERSIIRNNLFLAQAVSTGRPPTLSQQTYMRWHDEPAFESDGNFYARGLAQLDVVKGYSFQPMNGLMFYPGPTQGGPAAFGCSGAEDEAAWQRHPLFVAGARRMEVRGILCKDPRAQLADGTLILLPGSLARAPAPALAEELQAYVKGCTPGSCFRGAWQGP